MLYLVFVVASSVVTLFWWRVLNAFLSGDAPRSEGKSPAAPNGGLGHSQHLSWLPVCCGGSIAPGWGAQWGEGLKDVLDLELYLSTF